MVRYDLAALGEKNTKKWCGKEIHASQLYVFLFTRKQKLSATPQGSAFLSHKIIAQNQETQPHFVVREAVSAFKLLTEHRDVSGLDKFLIHCPVLDTTALARKSK